MAEMMVGEMNQETKQREALGFTKTGLADDAANAWSGNLLYGSAGRFERIEPVKHYKEYIESVEEKNAGSSTPKNASEILAKSDPEAVKKFDQLVDEFNEKREQIIAQKNSAAIKEFRRKVNKIVQGQEEPPKFER